MLDTIEAARTWLRLDDDPRMRQGVQANLDVLERLLQMAASRSRHRHIREVSNPLTGGKQGDGGR